jgi:hypothetical protein
MSAINRHNQLVDELDAIFAEMDELSKHIENEVMQSEDKMDTWLQLKSSSVKLSILTKMRKSGVVE